jgi:hypothetical protein
MENEDDNFHPNDVDTKVQKDDGSRILEHLIKNDISPHTLTVYILGVIVINLHECLFLNLVFAVLFPRLCEYSGLIVVFVPGDVDENEPLMT